MLPQFWNNDDPDGSGHGWGWYTPQQGATRYEMLYLDGMNTGRGFGTVLDQGMIWHNQLELSYPLVRNVLNVEGYLSADGIYDYVDEMNGFGDLRWYFSGGFGIKLRIPGFPLGLYWAKTANYDNVDGFRFNDGAFLGGEIVLAITTSIY